MDALNFSVETPRAAGLVPAVADRTRERNGRGEGERLRAGLLDAASDLLAESPAGAASEAVRAAGMAAFSLVVDTTTRCLDGRSDPYERACLNWLALHGHVSVQRAMVWFTLSDEDAYIDQLIDLAVAG